MEWRWRRLLDTDILSRPIQREQHRRDYRHTFQVNEAPAWSEYPDEDIESALQMGVQYNQ